MQRVLREIDCPSLITEEDIDDYTQLIHDKLKAAIEESTPMRRLVQGRSRRGWTEEMTKLRRETRRAKRASLLGKRPASEFLELHQEWKRVLRGWKRECHRDAMASASDNVNQLWRIVSWRKRRGIQQAPRIPPLTKVGVTPEQSQTAEQSQDIAEMLADSFFPPARTASLSDIGGPYPEPLPCPPITRDEIRRAIKEAATNKVPGPDDIPHEALKKAIEGDEDGNFITALHQLYNASLNLGYYPKHCRHSTTVPLRKTDKKEDTPKSYRPIALLNTIGKTLESIMAERLHYMAETEDTLPDTHLGGRKGYSAATALHTLVEAIYKAWNKGHTATILSLDVSGAFDHVSHDRLEHILKSKKLGGKWVNWVSSFLKGRSTMLRLPDYKTDMREVQIGIPQGSPLSPPLFILFNSEVVQMAEDITREEQERQTQHTGQAANPTALTGNATAIGWIDDVNYVVSSPNVQTNISILTELAKRGDEWTRTHGAKFAPEKFQMVHLIAPRSRRSADLDKAVLTFGDVTIEPRETVKILGVTIDPSLNFKAHVGNLLKGAYKKINVLACLNRSTWGAGVEATRTAYLAAIRPTFTYCCSVWYQGDNRNKAESTMAKIQTIALAGASGAFKTTGGDALSALLNVEPANLLLAREAEAETLRIANTRYGSKLIMSQPRTASGRHISPLRIHIRNLEKKLGPAAIMGMERVTAFVQAPWLVFPKVVLHRDAAKATEWHDSTLKSPGLHIYTDGSGINDTTSAAAVVWEDRAKKVAKLGPLKEFPVYHGEAQGLLMALELTRDSGRLCPVYIYSDNQGIVESLANPTAKAAQQILKPFHDLHRSMPNPITVGWIPAHTGIPGNELVDQLAKEAAGWRPTETSPLLSGGAPPPLATLRPSRRVRITQLQAVTQKHWERQWAVSAHGHQLRHQIKSPGPHTLEKYKRQSRAISSIMTQLSVKKVSLNSYLYKIKKKDSPNCDLCDRCTPQTVPHILLQCPALDQHRDTLWKAVGKKVTDMSTLLEDPGVAPHTAAFFLKANILHQFRWVDKQKEAEVVKTVTRTKSRPRFGTEGESLPSI